MQFSKISAAVAVLASTALAAPIYQTSGNQDSNTYETTDSGASGAAGSTCTTEGKVNCSGSKFQVCASGFWSVTMQLAQGTDCKIFGQGSTSGNGTMPPSVPTQPLTVPSESTVPVSTPAAGQQNTPAGTGFAGHQTYAATTDVAGVPTVPAQSSYTAPAQTSYNAGTPTTGTVPAGTSYATQPTSTGSGGDGGSSTPGQLQTYSGPEDSFPKSDKWVSFEKLWSLNPVCETLNNGKGDLIKQAIEDVSSECGVDKRVILAVVLQESTCNLNVVTTNGGVSNPGLMQSHNGVGYDGTDGSIKQMIKDGAEGTSSGDGLKQTMAKFGLYGGLRAYNSGDGGVNEQDLSQTGSGTPSYCSDVANRLTGAKVEDY